MREIEKLVMLKVIDGKWIEHLHNMDVLREGIGLRAWGQRDPLIEYKIEGYKMFQEMMEGARQEIVSMIYQGGGRKRGRRGEGAQTKTGHLRRADQSFQGGFGAESGQGRTQRPLSLRKREEIQEMLRKKSMIPRLQVCHTDPVGVTLSPKDEESLLPQDRLREVSQAQTLHEACPEEEETQMLRCAQHDTFRRVQGDTHWRNFSCGFWVFVFMFILAVPAFADYAPGQMLVKFRDGYVYTGNRVESLSVQSVQISSASIQALNAKYKVTSYKQTSKRGLRTKKLRSGRVATLQDLSNIYLIEFPKDVDVMSAVKDFQADPAVEYASPNYKRKVYTGVTPNDPYYVNDLSVLQNQWGLFKIWLNPVGSGMSGWDFETGTSEVKVAVIDTGVNYNHEDLLSRIDTADGISEVFYTTDFNDDAGHGTHVSGIIGAATSNEVGIAGVDWHCQIVPIKAFDFGGHGLDSDIINSLQWAIGINADVINMSFGDTADDTALHQWITNAANADCVLVAAAGNDNSTVRSYPAAYPEVISVAATGPDDTKASYSTFGNWVSVCAPGGDSQNFTFPTHAILSTYPFDPTGEASNNSYALLEGTSMATPFVVGLAALIRAQHPSISAEAVREIIESHCDNLDAINPSYVGLLGKGRINALASLGGLYGNISFPAQNGNAYGIVSVKGTASGEGFTGYILQDGLGSNPSGWVTLETSSSNVLNGVLGTMDTTGIDGKVTVRLIVNEDYSKAKLVTFKAGSNGDPLLFGHVDYGPNPFDPSTGQSIMIQYDLTRNAEVYVYFFDLTGRVIGRKYYKSGTAGGDQGTNKVFWDGHSDFGGIVANGAYLFQVISDGRKIGKGKIIVLRKHR